MPLFASLGFAVLVCVVPPREPEPMEPAAARAKAEALVSAAELRQARAALRELARRHARSGRHGFRLVGARHPDVLADRELRFEHMYAGVPVEDGVVTVYVHDDGISLRETEVVWDIRVSVKPRRSVAQVLAEHKFFAPRGQEARYPDEVVLVIFPQPIIDAANPEVPPKLRPRLAYRVSTHRLRHGALLPVQLWIDAATGEVLREHERRLHSCGMPDPMNEWP